MAAQQQVAAADNHVQMFQRLQTRDGTLTTDAKMVNLMVEEGADGPEVIKRPGTRLAMQFPTGPGQGTFLLNSFPHCIIGDTIYRIDTGQGWPIVSVTVPGQQYNCLGDTPHGWAIIKSYSGLWQFDGITVTKIADVNYPTTTRWGLVYLDGYYFVVESDGTLRQSALEDWTNWPALNFIAGDPSLGNCNAVHRHLNYVGLFYDKGAQLYYDAGQSPGVSVAPVGNAAYRTGVTEGRSMVESDDLTFFISRTDQKGGAVSMMSGLTIVKISTPYVERVINRSSLSEPYVWADALSINGHTLYILTLTDTQVTLVYDVVFKEWFVWSSRLSGVEGAFRYVHYLNYGSLDYFQDRETGAVVIMDANVYTDVSGTIPITIRSSNMDWGTMKRKYYATANLLADTVPTTVALTYSDNDYQTYSAARDIDLSTVHKMLTRLGSARRRSWQIQHEDNTPLRMESMELTMTLGAN